MFIAAVFTIAKLWKQSRCHKTNECVKKIWHIYTKKGEFPTIKKNKIMSFADK
jgi:hypothetical protein